MDRDYMGESVEQRVAKHQEKIEQKELLDFGSYTQRNTKLYLIKLRLL